MKKKDDNKKKKNSGLLGTLFDFNHDGKTDTFEAMIAYKEYEKRLRKKYGNSPDRYYLFPDENENDTQSLQNCNYNVSTTDDTDEYGWRNYCEDGFEYGIYPEDYETEEEYIEALNEEKYGWRDYCEDGSEYDIDPEDYETEEEYEEALDEAREEESYGADDTLEEEEEYPSHIDIPITLSFKVETPYQEAYDAIKGSDYPNKRKYNAALYLCEIEHDDAVIPVDSSQKKEIKKCMFILHSDKIAAKYLTIHYGFLFAQAVKENFALPISVPDEDEEPVTDFNDLFLEIAEEDQTLAVNIWRWCIIEFGPYREYMTNDRTIYNSIISSVEDYPEEFMDIAVKAIGSDAKFCQGLLALNPKFPSCIYSFIARALKLGLTEEAKKMFISAMDNDKSKGKDKDDLINRIISDCSDWEELEAMEAFKFNIIPLIEDMNDKRIKRLLPKFINKVDEYISYVEKNSAKYQFSRCHSWRKNCADGSEYGIDPLSYETEEEYNAAINEAKYRWRIYRITDKVKYGIDPNDYETEAEFSAAVDAEYKRRRQKEIEEIKQRQKQTTREKLSYTDPLAETDMKVYTFCGVMLPYSNTLWYYLTDDGSVSIGDKVMVSFGTKGNVIGEVATIEKHRRRTAPYPVDKTKYLKKI